MGSQTTVATLRSLDLGEYVITSTRTQKPEVSGELGHLFLKVVPDDRQSEVTVPDWDQIQEANASLLECSLANVRDKDQAHRLNQVTWDQMRADRKTLIDDLRDQHRGLRLIVTGTYGADALPLVGLDAPPEVRMVAVREQALELLERLREPRLAAQLPAPRTGVAPLDLEAIADGIETKIRELETLLAEMKRMRTTLDASLVARRHALQHHNQIYLNVARVQEAYYRLAGLDELAKRIRTVFRATRRKTKEAETETDPASQTEPEAQTQPEAQPEPAALTEPSSSTPENG